MRRTILLVVSLLLTMVGKADDVTPEQAMQQAQAFVDNVKGKKSGNVKSRRAESASSLKMEGRVDGLYVFNLEGDNGYVIVSDDDRTTPVLGFADSGHLDLDNMPENMKAWLQGYANEIAWIRANNIQPDDNAASRRVSAVKEPVAPLLLSEWYQAFPYNYLCPEYMPGVQADAGCVATAMAQCMYATEMRVGSTTTYTTADIPAYKTKTRGFSIDGIPAGTPINWSKMIHDFRGDYTGEQAIAVAELMYYCGVAVEMDYADDDNGASGAYSSDVPDALVNYFGYSPTAKYVVRDSYTYKSWIDMLYNELSQGRPVYYCGNTKYGYGHAFVCDGYWTEDYFHFDWGAAGENNGYFKLSVMEPKNGRLTAYDADGAYVFYQRAVIGIQKKEESGTTLEPTQMKVDLTPGNAYWCGFPTQGQDLEFSFEIVNKSTDAYDGWARIRIKYEDVEIQSEYIHISIPAMESRKISYPYIPKKAGKYRFTLSLPTQEGNFANYVWKEFIVAKGEVEEEKVYPDITDIDLGFRMTVENLATLYDAVKGDYDIYGNTFRGRLIVTNPNTEANFKGFIQYEVKKTYPEFADIKVKIDQYTVPAGGSIVIPIEFTGMAPKDYYTVVVSYYLGFGDDPWTPRQEVGYFYKRPSIVVNMADGTELEFNPKTLEQPDSYTVPAQAVSVDLRATGVTNITTKDGNPNIVYQFNNDDQVPSGLKNVLLYDVESKQYSTEKIEIEDGYNFASPVDFTTSDIEFTYTPDRWAGKNGGWNTLIVPFDVTSVTADGQPIDWFRSSTDEGKQFWLKEYTGDDPDIVYFDDVSGTMTAYTPYLIGLPGDYFGPDNDLSKKTIRFIGSGDVRRTQSETLTAGNYIYMGNTAQDNTEKIYTLNAAGTQFVLSNGNAPFRAYFTPITLDRSITALSIGSEELAVPVHELENHAPSTNIWYTLDGRRLSGKPNTKGIYIVDGKKVFRL